MKKKIKFVDNSEVTLDEIGKVLIQSKDEHEFVINDVLYVPIMKSNLISFGQLLEKNYSMKTEDKELTMYDED